MASSDQNGIDRLSNLPEHLLLHILSFLPTETVVSTIVLSKSWQFLWTLVPDLDFDYCRSHRLLQEYKSFANFVTRVFLHRKDKFTRRFRFYCHNPYDPSDLDLWVSYAMPQNVQELDLDLGCNDGDSFRFQCTQQSCKILEVLKLRTVLITLDKVSFPVLKILHLKMAKFECQDIKFLPSNFPVLEELVISGPINKNFEIYLPKLRSLAITLFQKCGLVRIDCPALTDLAVDGRKSREFHLENLLSLDVADIEIARHRTVLLDYDYAKRVRVHEDESYGGYVMNVVKAISNVRTLLLSLPTMNEIEFGSYPFFLGDDIPVFHNLVEVELVLKGCTCEIIIILMLQKFENLKCLTLYHEKTGGRGGYVKELIQTNGPGVDMKELIQTDIPNCLTCHLTTFYSVDFKGKDDEMKITRYILENSLILEEMTILFSSSLSLEDGHRIERELCKSPRGSEGCYLEFDRLLCSDSDSEYFQSSDSEDLDDEGYL